GEGVFGELRELQHGDLAVFFLQRLVARVVAEAGATLEDVADRPGVGGDPGQFLLFGKGRRRNRAAECDAGGRNTGARAFQKSSSAVHNSSRSIYDLTPGSTGSRRL